MRSVLAPLLTLALAACGGGSHSGADGSVSGTDAAALPTGGCGLTYAGCTAHTLSDHTADTGMIELAFDMTATSISYTSKCLLIHTGQQVVLPAGSANPLVGSTCSSPGSPLPTTTPAVGTTRFTFTQSGIYGYHSTTMGADDGSGLSGLIVVE